MTLDEVPTRTTLDLSIWRSDCSWVIEATAQNVACEGDTLADAAANMLRHLSIVVAEGGSAQWPLPSATLAIAVLRGLVS